MYSVDDMRSCIQEWFGEALTPVEVAKTYHEIQQEAEDYKPDRFERREEEKIQYPMLEKLRKVEGKSHLCGEFLDFIRSKYVLFDPAIPREQFGYVGPGDYINPEKLLAEFFGIDMEQVEEERQQILRSLH